MNEKQKNIIQFQKAVNSPLVLDGAVGSLLQQRKVTIDKMLWSSWANIVAPEKVIEVHREYINAGADIITTNTFRTNPTVANRKSLNISNSEFVKRSVDLAIEAIKNYTNIFIAGSNPPAEDSYQAERKISQKEVELNHTTHINMLWDSEVDFILNETQSHFDEIKIICEHCSKNDIPFVVSLFINYDGNLLSGEDVNYVTDFIADYSPIAIGINCVAPITFEKIIGGVNFKTPWGYYLNCGSGKYTDAEIFEGVSPTDYIGLVDKYLNKNPFFIGTCCGSNPNHTKAIKEYLLGKNKN